MSRPQMLDIGNVSKQLLSLFWGTYFSCGKNVTNLNLLVSGNFFGATLWLGLEYTPKHP